jgi:hypothetical protein
MKRIPATLSALALTCLLAASSLQAAPAAAVEKTFQDELKSALARGLESKRGLVFHLHGEKLPGVVKQVLTDAVIVANQEHAYILIRLDRIDAVEAD